MKDIRNIIVIGASAGGIAAINKVVAGLSGQKEIVVLVVLHVSRKSNSSIIAAGFQKHTSLICEVATNGMPIVEGHLYLAPPDHQFMVKDGFIKINQGPHENKYRPSIDILFRSVAVNYGHRVIGVILTGLLEDGTSGMHAIKRSGGICIVQEPSEAEYADMPRSVLNKIEVDYQATMKDIPVIIKEILKQPLPPEQPIPAELQIEADITEKMMSSINQLKKIADRSDFVCPDCGGGLWHVKNDPVHRYRCHTGHVYTEKLLSDIQDENIEESVWVSIRMLEEKRNLLLLMATREDQSGDTQLAMAYQKRINEVSTHINRLKSFLIKLSEDLSDPEKDLV
ncbi:MAG TPA: chemotaxis protein CheB [Flavobacterium sp.]|jgi:two-component system chemotaxis response regulator CheB